MCYILKVGGRAPTKILFSKSTGNITQIDFFPTFDPQGVIDCPEPVPFRLTRNLNTFLTPFGVEGMFVACMSAAARALVQPKTSLQYHLALYFRDELTAWFSRPRGANATYQSGQGGQAGAPKAAGVDDAVLKKQVQENVNVVYARIMSLVGGGALSPQQQDGIPRDIHQPINELVERALNSENLCKLDPMWHPWL